MSVSLRIILIIASIITLVFVFRKIKKAQFVVEDTLYWFFFCLILLLFSLFPKIPYSLSKLCGFEATSNFVFVTIIFLLLIKLFMISVKLSKLETRISRFIQEYALHNRSNKDNGKII